MVYVFGGEGLQLPENEDIVLADTKVTYSGKAPFIKSNDVTTDDVTLYDAQEPDAQLYSLAYISGGYSRYKTDHHFREKEFKDLYGEWMRKSAEKTIADGLFCHRNVDRIVDGMVTFKFKDDVCSIGLIAVDENVRSRGIGKQMMKAVQGAMMHKGIISLEVVTQQYNISACRFYERCGLAVSNVSKVYHCWFR